MYQRYNNKIKYVLNDKEYYEFLSKFRGSLIFRGKSSLSYKLLDKIFFSYKETFGIETDYLFKKAVINLMPFIGHRSVKLGKKIHYVPMLLKKHRRFKLLFGWLLKSNKNKSNVRGFKINDVCKMFYDALFSTGPIFDLKSEHYKKSMSSRHLLRTLNKSKKGKYNVRKIIKSKKEDKLDYVYTNATIKRLLHSLLFLNFYSTKKIRKFNASLRRGLKYAWFNKKMNRKQKFKYLLRYAYDKKKFLLNTNKSELLLNNKFYINSFYEKKKTTNNTF